MKRYIKSMTDYEQKLFERLPEDIKKQTKQFWIYYPTRYISREYHLVFKDGRHFQATTIKDLKEMIERGLDVDTYWKAVDKGEV